MIDLILEVGKTYITSDDRVVEIVERMEISERFSILVFRGSDNECYSESGIILTGKRVLGNITREFINEFSVPSEVRIFTPTIPSTACNNCRSTHRIVGSFTDDRGTQSGILGYYSREEVGDAIKEMRDFDPDASLRVEPHNSYLSFPILNSTDVEWIVNEENELGVKIGTQFFFCHRGQSFMYDESCSPRLYRNIEKKADTDETLRGLDPNFRDHGEWYPIDLTTARKVEQFSN